MAEVLFTIDDILKATGGEIYSGAPFVEKEVRSVVIDSREALPGCLFVPLKGENTDGHMYIGEVFANGGRIAFVDRGFWNSQKDALKSYAAKNRSSYVIVSSPLQALQTLSAWFLRKKRCHRIGVTGSNGKTTTKEIIGSILSRKMPAFMNRGNLNSEIGLPLSVFEVKDEHKWAVFEMGMNHPGEMDILTDIVRPEDALITNIGMAHIGILGSKFRIAEEKKKILLGLVPDGRGFVYENDEFYTFLRENVDAHVLPFGEKTTDGFEAADDRGLDGWEIHYQGEHIRLPLAGTHNLRNALGAISLCSYLGMDVEVIKAGIEAVKPLFGRGRVFRGDVTILEDCYNANPDSMASALEFLLNVSWRGRKVALLASMKELGDLSDSSHKTVGDALARSGFDGVFLFGQEMEVAFQTVKNGKYKGFLHHTNDLDVLIRELSGFLRAGDLVLAKGSRSMAMERVTESIRKVRVQEEGCLKNFSIHL